MNKLIFLTVILISFVISACKEVNDEPWNSESLNIYEITPISGGATILYDLPREKDLLYILVEYERNGKIFTEKSSVFKNSITIEGFNTKEEVKAVLYKVNKFNQKSKPVEVEFIPLDSPINIAQNSLVLSPAFGGLNVKWDNPSSTELGVRLMFVDSIEQIEFKEMYFSTVNQEDYTFRGFESEETKFALTIEDKWGNQSDTVWYTTTPFFETIIEKPYADFRQNIPYDNTTDLSGKPYKNLWDNLGNVSGNGWLTQPGSSGLSFTIDMRQTVKLSRIIVHGYHVNDIYRQVNILQMEIWGTDKIDFNKLTDLPYWLDEFSVRAGAIHGIDPETELPEKTFKDDWQYLGYHSLTRYDLMVPYDQQAFLDLSARGMEYIMPIEAKPVRYIRIYARMVTNANNIASNIPPPSNNYISMGEITFYGDNQVPQN